MRLPAVSQRQKALSRFGQLNVADSLLPVEQLGAHLCLQRLDAVGQRGLRDKQRVGRRRQGAVLQYGPKGFHVGIVHGTPPEI